jgi:hypothetical protein
MLLHANEEIARWRTPRKILRLPAAAANAPAEVWLCLCEYPGNDRPLEVRINGRRAGSILPQSAQAGAWQWRKVPLRRAMVGAGSNEIILGCDSPAMNAWMLAVEAGHRNPSSALSTDRGRTWSENVGVGGRLRGEYLIRARVDDPKLAEQRVPAIVYEDQRRPRVRELRNLVPANIQRIGNPWKQVLALRTWVARAWTYEAFGNNYAPWDPWTVLAWKRADWGHGHPRPIAMCVHYGMVMSALATALGHPARGLAITEDINGPNGHFMCEIWDHARGKWIAHDPKYDLQYEDEHGPMSGIELAERARAGRSSRADIRQGAGFTSDCPRLHKLLDEKLATGQAFNNLAIWRQNNYISDPAAAPPNHGSVIYCETDLVWHQPEGDATVAPMFPYRAGGEYFSEAPKNTGGRT